jgi:phosphoribosylglycinamide formyltransferase-1
MPGKSMTVAVLCSGRAPGLLHALSRDGRRDRAYQIVCCISSDAAFADLAQVERCGVPTHAHPIRRFYEERGASVCGDPAVRAEYDTQMADLLMPYSPDLVLLDGYLYLITAPLLTAFPGRILNLHFSDLTLRKPDGRPRFPGIRAVHDTLAAGLPETYATMHLVNAEPDDGAPILRSWPFPVSPMVTDALAWKATDLFKAYAYAHQEWMIGAAAGPMLVAALELVGAGVVDLTRLGTAEPHTIAPWQLDEHGHATAPMPEGSSCAVR